MDSQSQSGDGVPLSKEPKDLVYGEHIRRDLKLMEVPVALLKEIMENGADIKAASDMDKAYLCTKDCTYAIKTNDNTHHVALVEPAQDEENKVVLSGITAGRFEVVEDVSSIDRVYEMLRERPYDENEDVSMECEMDPIAKGNVYTLDELYEASQVSVGEVKEVLEDLSAFQINGCWRVFEHQYLNKMVDQIFFRINLQGWDMSSIPISELEKMMVDEGYNIAAVQSCISLLGNSTEGEDMDDLWKIDKQKVCVHFAKRLLVQDSWTLNEFVKKWSRSLPFEFKPSKDMLFGEAIINEAQGTIKGFFKDDLPKDYRARVKAIFAEKDFWDPDELRTFLCDAKFPGEWSLDVALLELCQKCRFRLNDPDMYCIRSSAFTAG